MDNSQGHTVVNVHAKKLITERLSLLILWIDTIIRARCMIFGFRSFCVTPCINSCWREEKQWQGSDYLISMLCSVFVNLWRCCHNSAPTTLYFVSFQYTIPFIEFCFNQCLILFNSAISHSDKTVCYRSYCYSVFSVRWY